MTTSNLEVTAAPERRESDVRLYVLALIALARQLQEEQEQAERRVVPAPEVSGD